MTAQAQRCLLLMHKTVHQEFAFSNFEQNLEETTASVSDSSLVLPNPPTVYPVSNWDSLCTYVEQLETRMAILIGFIQTRRSFDSKTLSFTKAPGVLYLYAVPPSIEDPNSYSLHIQIPPEDESVSQIGPQIVKDLLEHSFVVGFCNGVHNNSAAEMESAYSLHKMSYLAVKNLSNLLKQ